MERFDHELPQSLEPGPQFVRGAEERIFHGFFGGAERFADGAQFHSLVVPHLKNHSLARRERLERSLNLAPNFVAQDLALRI